MTDKPGRPPPPPVAPVAEHPDASTRVFSPAALEADDVGRTWARHAERVPLEPGALLGSGGAGAVYRARDQALRRDVALKVLRADDADAARRFLAEAQVLAQLAHPYIVPVYRVGVDADGRPCFAMKLVEGRTLGDKLAELQGMSAPARARFALPVLVKICDAVDYAHSRGVIHCDLKPDNVMVGAFGEVTLMDWGIARALPRPGGVVVDDAPRVRAGTPAYMAPEQAIDPSAVDERSDVFGLGAILHDVLLRRPPRASGADLADMLLEIPPIDAAALTVPRALVDLCARALAREPRRRPPSAAAFREELEATLEERASVDVREVAAGDVVVREGEPGVEAFVIVRGTCAAWRDIGGARTVLREMGPGDVFGEAAVLDGGARTASVSAVDDVELVVVPAEEITGRLGARSFVTALAKRFRDVEARAAAAEAKAREG